MQILAESKSYRTLVPIGNFYGSVIQNFNLFLIPANESILPKILHILSETGF